LWAREGRSAEDRDRLLKHHPASLVGYDVVDRSRARLQSVQVLVRRAEDLVDGRGDGGDDLAHILGLADLALDPRPGLGVAAVEIYAMARADSAGLLLREQRDDEVELTVGSVGKVLEAQWGSLQVRVDALGGQGQVSLDGARATARDMLLISLAGPAASACGLVVTAVALAWVPPGLVHDALWVAMLFSVAAALSVVPLAVSRAAPGRPEVRSDGQLALAAARVLWQLR